MRSLRFRTLAVLLLSLPLFCGPAIAATCGDGLFTVGETCASCPADCAPKTCTADSKAHRRYAMSITTPLGQQATGVTALISYRSGTLSMPGTADDASIEQRIQRHVAPDMLIARDADYAMSIMITMAKGLPSTPLLDIDFDTCTGAPPPAADDISCELVGCSGSGGPLAGCSCVLAAAQP
jgi:hypothetical protein